MKLGAVRAAVSSKREGYRVLGGLIVLIVAILFLFFGLFHWASKDPGIDREIAKQRFQAEQELRGLHRSSGSGSTSTQDSDRLPDGR